MFWLGLEFWMVKEFWCGLGLFGEKVIEKLSWLFGGIKRIFLSGNFSLMLKCLNLVRL